MQTPHKRKACSFESMGSTEVEAVVPLPLPGCCVGLLGVLAAGGNQASRGGQSLRHSLRCLTRREEAGGMLVVVPHACDDGGTRGRSKEGEDRTKKKKKLVGTQKKW